MVASISGWGRALGLLLIPACAGPSPAWGDGPRGTQGVAIHNPAGAELRITSCERAGPADLEPGAPETLRIDLPLGRWTVEARCGGRAQRLPLPLPAGATRPGVVRLAVTVPPAARPGLAWIPAGPALVGDILGVGQEDERPARVLEVDAFWIATTETTHAEFVPFLNGCGEVDPDWLALDSRKCRIQRDAEGRFSTDAPDRPVVTVSHTGAIAYCDWRTRVTARRHRLPTEIEWEKAARGPCSTTYAYGDVYRRAAANQESGELRPAGGFEPNGFGLHDMTGNAFEWTADAYRAGAYGADGSAGLDPDSDAPYRVLRGGSFVLDGIYLRNAMRMKLRPGVRADDVGFRVVVEPEGTEP